MSYVCAINVGTHQQRITAKPQQIRTQTSFIKEFAEAKRNAMKCHYSDALWSHAGCANARERERQHYMSALPVQCAAYGPCFWAVAVCLRQWPTIKSAMWTRIGTSARHSVVYGVWMAHRFVTPCNRAPIMYAAMQTVQFAIAIRICHTEKWSAH